MLTETLTVCDKLMTTIALAIMFAALIAAVWMVVYVAWSVLDWIAERIDKWKQQK